MYSDDFKTYGDVSAYLKNLAFDFLSIAYVLERFSDTDLNELGKMMSFELYQIRLSRDSVMENYFRKGVRDMLHAQELTAHEMLIDGYENWLIEVVNGGISRD